MVYAQQNTYYSEPQRVFKKTFPHTRYEVREKQNYSSSNKTKRKGIELLEMKNVQKFAATNIHEIKTQVTRSDMKRSESFPEDTRSPKR